MKAILSRATLPVVLWGGACIGMALAIGVELDWGRRLHAPLPVLRKPAAKPAETPLLPEFSLPPLAQGYSETASRPLFVVTRRPAPPLPSPTLIPAMQKGQFVLLGVTIAGDVSIALLKEKSGTKIHRVKKGTQINGITLEKVEAEKILLTQSGDSEELILKIQPMAKPAPTPAVAGQQPGQPVPAGAPAAQPAPDGAAATQQAPSAAAAAKNTNDLINRRRALRGLPPL